MNKNITEECLYKKTENYSLYLGDVLKVLKTMPNESVDMIFTSPPYNLGISNVSGDFKLEYDNWEDDMPYEEYCKWQLEILNECYRIVKKDGFLFYNHKDKFKNNEYRNPIFFIKDSKWNIRQNIIWSRKQCFNYTTGAFGNFYENIYLLYKDEQPKLETKHSIVGDVWEIGIEKNNKHPAPFPLELPLRAIYSLYDEEENKVIMDIFNGSGTTGVASLLLNHKYIGIDIGKKYLDMSIKRLDNYMCESMKGQAEINKHQVKNSYSNNKNITNQISIFEIN